MGVGERKRVTLLAAVVLLGISGCGDSTTGPDAAAAVSTPDARIADALSAGPPSITAQAAVEDYPAKAGHPFPLLRKGTGPWTCFPTGASPGDGPACYDPNAML